MAARGAGAAAHEATRPRSSPCAQPARLRSVWQVSKATIGRSADRQQLAGPPRRGACTCVRRAAHRCARWVAQPPLETRSWLGQPAAPRCAPSRNPAATPHPSVLHPYPGGRQPPPQGLRAPSLCTLLCARRRLRGDGARRRWRAAPPRGAAHAQGRVAARGGRRAAQVRVGRVVCMLPPCGAPIICTGRCCPSAKAHKLAPPSQT